ncbi:MAG: 50S ribosomal protein L37ae [Candidatus Micrarchaeia archaeon]
MVSSSVRGGRSVKVRLQKIYQKKRQKYQCPRCEKKTVRRKESGIWHCRSCGVVFVGGAYSPTTPTGEVAARIISDLRKGKKI